MSPFAGDGVRDGLLRFARLAASLSTRVGEAAAWVYPVLVAVLIVNVVLRYGLGRGFIELEELQWHLYAAGFLLAYAYAAVHDDHVRVDLFHARFSPKRKAAVELAGTLLLLFPFTVIVGLSSWDFFTHSWALGESSSMPSGLPARWIIKFVLFFALMLLSLQALGSVARSLATLMGAPADEATPPDGATT